MYIRTSGWSQLLTIRALTLVDTTSQSTGTITIIDTPAQLEVPGKALSSLLEASQLVQWLLDSIRYTLGLGQLQPPIISQKALALANIIKNCQMNLTSCQLVGANGVHLDLNIIIWSSHLLSIYQKYPSSLHHFLVSPNVDLNIDKFH